MTYRKLAPWLAVEDVLSKPLRGRIKYVRMNLKSSNPTPRRPYMDQDEFAEAVGAKDRHRVIGWEKRGETPRDYAEAIAMLTPYPPSAFGAPGAAELEEQMTGSRLRSLEEKVATLLEAQTRILADLDEARTRLARVESDRTPRADGRRKKAGP